MISKPKSILEKKYAFMELKTVGSGKYDNNYGV